MRRKINYVIATFGGPRNEKGFRYGETLDAAVATALYSCPSVSQITIMSPVGPHEKTGPWEPTEDFSEALSRIKNNVDKVVVVHRESNDGKSYGSFSDAYEIFRFDNFTHYIFTEDDYAFFAPGIDTDMCDILDGDKDIGFLCAKCAKRFQMHASVSIGAVRAGVIEEARKKFGLVPYVPEHFDGIVDEEDRCSVFDDQIAFSHTFVDLGYKIHDLIGYGYRIGYRNSRTGITHYFGPETSKLACGPVQDIISDGSFFD